MKPETKYIQVWTGFEHVTSTMPVLYRPSFRATSQLIILWFQGLSGRGRWICESDYIKFCNIHFLYLNSMQRAVHRLWIFLPSVTSQWDNSTSKPDIKDHDKGRLLNLLKISPVLTNIIASNDFFMDMLSRCSLSEEICLRLRGSVWSCLF